MAVPVSHDPEKMATVMKQLRDLEQQVKAQTNEMLSKVGPQQGRVRVWSEGWWGPGWGDE